MHKGQKCIQILWDLQKKFLLLKTTKSARYVRSLAKKPNFGGIHRGLKIFLYLNTEHLKNPTLSGGTYLYSVYKGVSPPGDISPHEIGIFLKCLVFAFLGDKSLNNVRRKISRFDLYRSCKQETQLLFYEIKKETL